MAGTVVGVIAGAVLAHLVGDRVWLQIVVVLVSLFLGLYLFRVNYAFMAIGITVMVSQLYVELDEFSNNLLLLRLAETGVGAGVAILTVLLVLPLLGSQASRVTGFTATAAAARHYASNLLLDASTRYPDLNPQASAALGTARGQLAGSIGAVTGALAPASGDGSQPAPPYVRSASLFARVADELPVRPYLSRPYLALRDLQLLDGALAEAARWAGVLVTDLDTAGQGTCEGRNAQPVGGPLGIRRTVRIIPS